MKILVCKHVPQEGMGYLETTFTENQVEYEYQELYNDHAPRRLRDYHGLIIMGGPMNVDQISEYPFLQLDYDYIEEALKMGIPVLGFCLGGQLIARVLGAKVVKNPEPELGWYDLKLTGMTDGRLFKDFPYQFKVFQWHQDTFEIPKDAKLLAGTKSCLNQAFSWGNKVFGLQFHLEVTTAMIQEWLQDQETLEQWGFKPGSVLKETTENIEQALSLCGVLGRNFINLLENND